MMHVLLPGPRSEWPAEKIVLVTPGKDYVIHRKDLPPIVRTFEDTNFPDRNVPRAWFDAAGEAITFAVHFRSGSAFVSHALYERPLNSGLARCPSPAEIQP